MAKQCPNCNGFALYEDTMRTCPMCGHTLVTYQRAGAAQPTGGAARPAGNAARPTGGAARPTGGAARPTGNAARPTGGAARPTGNAARPTGGAARPTGNAGQAPVQQEPEFMTELGGRRVQFRGTVREVTHTTRLHSKLKKVVNCLFQREPYQLGHTSHYTMIRIEEYHPGRYAGNTEDLIFYGDVEGRLYRGDDVTVTAKRVGDRYVVTRLELNESRGDVVNPTPQLSAAVIIAMILLLIGAPIAFVANGGLYALASALGNAVSALLPTILTFGLVIYIIYKIIRPD